MSAYLESDLSARARRRLERHTAECADCTSVLASLRHMLGLLGGLGPLDQTVGTPQIAEAVLQRIHESADR
jgi:anti-sigma factor RsiW